MTTRTKTGCNLTSPYHALKAVRDGNVSSYTQRGGLWELQALIPSFSEILIVLIEKRLANLNDGGWQRLTVVTGKSMA